MRTRLAGGLAALIMTLGLAASVQAVGPITSLTITPTEARVIAGTTQNFTVQGRDASGVTTDLTANAVFSSTDPTGKVAANNYTSGRAGQWRVVASYHNVTAQAQITVTPGPVIELTINPNSNPEYVVNGTSRSFSAEAFDAFDNKVSTVAVQWSVEGNVGTIKSTSDTAARFTAAREDAGRVIARSGEITTSVDVTVTKAVMPNANINARGNVNPNQNSNANVSGETGSTATNGNSNAADTNKSVPATTELSSCQAWPKSSWIWLFVAYLVLLVLSLYPIRATRPAWWWVGPLIVTIAALWLYFQYRCYPVYPALPYVILLTGIVAASWYNWQRASVQPKL